MWKLWNNWPSFRLRRQKSNSSNKSRESDSQSHTSSRTSSLKKMLPTTAVKHPIITRQSSCENVTTTNNSTPIATSLQMKRKQSLPACVILDLPKIVASQPTSSELSSSGPPINYPQSRRASASIEILKSAKYRTNTNNIQSFTRSINKAQSAILDSTVNGINQEPQKKKIQQQERMMPINEWKKKSNLRVCNVQVNKLCDEIEMESLILPLPGGEFKSEIQSSSPSQKSDLSDDVFETTIVNEIKEERKSREKLFKDNNICLKQNQSNAAYHPNVITTDLKITPIISLPDDEKLITISSDEKQESRLKPQLSINKKRTVSPKDTHELRKMSAFDLALCRLCDDIIYVNGQECVHCGLLAHQACLSNMIITCNHHQLSPKCRVFGIDLINQDQPVPELMLQCITELERRGYANIKGVYIRAEMTALQKRTIAKLCCSIENGPHLVDFSRVGYHEIGEVLKLFLSELSVPLILTSLETKLLNIAKRFSCSSIGYSLQERRMMVFQMRLVVHRLPSQHYSALSYMMSHLGRIAARHLETRMPATLLAIIFTSILMNTIDVSVNSRVNSLLRTRAIELMIICAEEIFDEVQVMKMLPFLPNQGSDALASNFNNNNNNNSENNNKRNQNEKVRKCNNYSSNRSNTTVMKNNF